MPISMSRRMENYLKQSGRRPAPGEAEVTALTPAQRRRAIKKVRRDVLKGRV